MTRDLRIGVVTGIGSGLVRSSFYQRGPALLPSRTLFSFPMLWKSCSVYFLGFLISQVKVNKHLFPFSSNKSISFWSSYFFCAIGLVLSSCQCQVPLNHSIPWSCESSTSSQLSVCKPSLFWQPHSAVHKKNTGARLWRVKTPLNKLTAYVSYTVGGKSYRCHQFCVLLEWLCPLIWVSSYHPFPIIFLSSVVISNYFFGHLQNWRSILLQLNSVQRRVVKQ